MSRDQKYIEKKYLYYEFFYYRKFILMPVL